jgi:hypothetical protein
VRLEAGRTVSLEALGPGGPVRLEAGRSVSLEALGPGGPKVP